MSDYPIVLSDRDRRIVQFVGRYQQSSSKHIQAVLFPDLSRTPVDRALTRLVEAGFLHRIERRLVGGSQGGSGQYVYSLGRRGFAMLYEGKFTPARSVRFHSLAIVDCVVTLRALERAGKLRINGISAEPDCWLTISGVELKPDLYVDLVRSDGRALKLWLEVDLGSEGQRQVRAKLERYGRVYHDPASDDELAEFPGILWVTLDAERAKELRWIIGQLSTDIRGLFRVVELQHLASIFA